MDQSIGETFGIYDIEQLKRASKLLTMDKNMDFIKSMLRVGKEGEYKIEDDIDPLSFYRAMIEHYDILDNALDGQKRLGLIGNELLSVNNTQRSEFMKAVGVIMYLKAILPIFTNIGKFNGTYSSMQEMENMSDEEFEDLRVQISFMIMSIKGGRKPMKGFWKKLLFQSKTDKLHDLFFQQPLIDIIKCNQYSEDEIASAMLSLS